MSQIFYGGRTPKPHRHEWAGRFDYMDVPVQAGVAVLPDGRRVETPSEIVRVPYREPGYVCIRCGKLKDEAVSRRGTNNRKRGNAIERWVCALLGIRRVGQYGGKEDGGSSEDFLVVQVKSGGAFQAALLSKIHTVPSRGDQLRAWVTASTPGPGARREGVISFDLEEFARWYGKGTAE